MTEVIVLQIVTVLVLGIGAQWVAQRIGFPSILLLLVLGFIAGPVTGIINPEGLSGEWVLAFVQLAIGIILFEGGLSLRVSELGGAGRVVVKLITLGVLVTWVLAALGAYYIAGFNVGLSIQIGAILTVTGPTVVIPLLRHVRPSGRVGAIAKWEGITIDPVGAVLAVLVLESIQSLSQADAGGGWGEVALHVFEGLLMTISVSLGLSILGAFILIVMLKRYMIPDYLQNAVALMVVVTMFALSNMLQPESGLLQATLMGLIMANQKYVRVSKLVEFKEDLQVMLIATLFIVLSARLDLGVLQFFDAKAFLFLGALILIVRPLAVFVSSIGSDINFKEYAFLSWMAPRGIVAAAVASLFAVELEEIYHGEVAGLVPIIFFVIVGTVAVYGLTISPLARYLGLSEPNPQGLLLAGAHNWAVNLAEVIKKHGFRVLLVDTNTDNIEVARAKGLEARISNVISEQAKDELNLGGIGQFISLTQNDEVNSLAALNFTSIFGHYKVYQLAQRPDDAGGNSVDIPEHLRGRNLFSDEATFDYIEQRYQDGGQFLSLSVTADESFEFLKSRYGRTLDLLFVIREKSLLIHTPGDQLTPQAGDHVIVLRPSLGAKELSRSFFDTLLEDAIVTDADEPQFDAIIKHVSDLFARELPVTSERLYNGFIEIAKSGGMPVTKNVALPHVRVPGIDLPRLALIRCDAGIPIEESDVGSPTAKKMVKGFVFLVGTADKPGIHLRTLAYIAQRIDTPGFIEQWLEAKDMDELKAVLQHSM